MIKGYERNENLEITVREVVYKQLVTTKKFIILAVDVSGIHVNEIRKKYILWSSWLFF